MKNAVYGYGQSFAEDEYRGSRRFIGRFRSKTAFHKALLQIPEVNRYASKRWAWERISESGNWEELHLTLNRLNTIFRYDHLTNKGSSNPATAVVVWPPSNNGG